MNLDELKAALEADPDKAKLFEETLAGMTPEKAGSEAEAISLAAAAAGFEVTPEEIERCAVARLEADEAELGAVAGGWWGLSEDSEGHDSFCFGVAWHCWYTFLHTGEGESNQMCWSDWQCGMNFRKTCSNNTNIKTEQYCILTWEHE